MKSRVVEVVARGESLLVEESYMDCGTIVSRRVIKILRAAETNFSYGRQHNIVLNERKRPKKTISTPINTETIGRAKIEHRASSAELKEIRVLEIARAVDVIMIKFNCPICNQYCFSGIDSPYCDKCGDKLNDFHLDIKKVKNKRNITAIPDKKRRSTGRITKKQISLLLDIQEYICAYCTCDLRKTDYHVDHIIPVAAGGTSNINNLAMSCSECNLIASSKVFSDINSKRAFILDTIKQKRKI